MSLEPRPLAICLMGPTASGKTDLAIALKQHIPVELISVDSALIYKQMDIGTAKPTAAEQAQAPHRLIDILDPAESYSAADFVSDAHQQMAEIVAAGKIPLLVGGTMLYFKALIEGLSPLPAADKTVREQLNTEAEQLGWETMHHQLQQIDPVSAERIHPNDPQRILRALEVYRISGKSMTELTQTKAPPSPYRFVQFAISPSDRKVLHQRIEQRFLAMLAQPFEQEVQALIDRGDLSPELPSIRCVGYRQMWSYLHGEIDKEAMIAQGVAATRQLAKRQLTWLRGWPQLDWLESGDGDNLHKILRKLAL